MTPSLICLLSLGAADAPAVLQPDAPAVLRPDALLRAQSFWDNQDWDWYRANIPFFECPDEDINTTYYYRWELTTKHLVYGSPASGYAFTEFIDRPFWSGAYGAISCPAGHQLYEVRWLRDPRYARDYARYWYKTPGAQPRNYSTWLADAVWAVHQTHPDERFIVDLLADMKRNYEGWEARHFDREVGLFWQTGHDDGMEFNINSRQTADIVRGAPGYRPTLNAYLWADARAIAKVADLASDPETAGLYRAKAEGLKRNLQAKLWDPGRKFFFPMAMKDEERDGFKVVAGSLTYQSGKHAGSPYGRELIGYVPWQFEMLDAGFEAAWAALSDPKGFAAEFGPTVVERRDPMFLVTDHCCWWSGQSWPYATTQTLKGLSNLLQTRPDTGPTKADYLKLLTTYARTHRKDGRPYIAEGANPDTGSWKGYDSFHHSEHYFHSGFNDLIITGLVGLRPRDDDMVEIVPLAPSDWSYFALDALPYRGRILTVLWDRDGTRYGKGRGLRLLADGVEIASSRELGRLTAALPPKASTPAAGPPINFAVNNDGLYFPRIAATSTAPGMSIGKAVDGNYWYHALPPNRWVGETGRTSDAVEIDFGVERTIDHVKLYLLDDGGDLRAPDSMALEFHDGASWRPISGATASPGLPTGRRANVVRFPAKRLSKIRAVLNHPAERRVGLTEFEAWGPADQSFAPAPMPSGNLAFNPGDRPFPKMAASYTSRFDKVERAIDGVVNFLPNPPNRWTAYESPNASDWIELDFGAIKELARVELAIYDDRGGVQAPESIAVETWDGNAWRTPSGVVATPARPEGGRFNEVRFAPASASKLRVIFRHRGRARSGVSEILVWSR